MRKRYWTVLISLGFAVASAALAASPGVSDATTYRADCQFQAEVSVPKPRFCYASIGYQVQASQVSGNVHIGVACDNALVKNDVANVISDSQADQIVPSNPVTPGLELHPSGALVAAGSHPAVLDLSFKKMQGSCTVRAVTAQPAIRTSKLGE